MPTRPRRRRPLEAITPRERVAVAAMAALAAAGALLARPHPTPHLLGNVVLTAAFAVAVTLCASVARTWAWVALASAAAVFGAQRYPVGAVAVEGFALVSAFVDIAGRRVYGAVVGAVAVQLLLRLGAGPFVGSTALVVAVAAIAPVVTSWTLMRSSTRRRIRRSGYVLGTLAVAFTLAAGFYLVRARSEAREATASLRNALAAARSGDTSSAAAKLAQGADSLSVVHDQVSSWLLRPAQLIPVLGQQLDTIERVSATASTAAAAASRAVSEADIGGLRMRGGRIDVARVAATAKPLDDLRGALASVDHELHTVRSPWLLAPVADRMDRLGREVDKATQDAETASEVVAVAPDLLGAKAPRHYFVAFGQPAESRDLGGFLGGFGELVVDNGKLSLVRVGRAADLDAGGPHPLTDPSGLPARYRSFELGRYWEDITASPELPTVARAVSQLWQSSSGGGDQLDGVLYVDPAGLAALLRLTGPVQTPSFGELSADNVVGFLTRDQYTRFQVVDQRHDLLADAAKLVFDKLTSGDLPAPAQIAGVLSEPAQAGHLLLHSFHDAEQRLVAQFGIDGKLPEVEDDSLTVTTSNRGMNKLDAYLSRSVAYDVQLDPATGSVRSTLKIDLHNGVPAEGLPDYVAANGLGEPRGTNDLIVDVWSPLQLDRATIDGAPTPFDTDQSYGRFGYSVEAAVPPGASKRVELQLHGRLGDPGSYRLSIGARAAVGDQPLDLRITVPSGWLITNSHGLEHQAESAHESAVLVKREDVWVKFGRS